MSPVAGTTVAWLQPCWSSTTRLIISLYRIKPETEPRLLSAMAALAPPACGLHARSHNVGCVIGQALRQAPKDLIVRSSIVVARKETTLLTNFPYPLRLMSIRIYPFHLSYFRVQFLESGQFSGPM